MDFLENIIAEVFEGFIEIFHMSNRGWMWLICFCWEIIADFWERAVE